MTIVGVVVNFKCADIPKAIYTLKCKIAEVQQLSDNEAKYQLPSERYEEDMQKMSMYLFALQHPGCFTLTEMQQIIDKANQSAKYCKPCDISGKVFECEIVLTTEDDLDLLSEEQYYLVSP